ncbi:MAG TPA: nitroreductase family protein [Acidimicrobiia bacterium]|nr:nitroreductase family protein [Acidimicrobiia bacterium]
MGPLPFDDVLTTTRAVRRRLDLSRPVEPELLTECLALALQAPTGGNDQGWHFVVITDPERRAALADLFRRGAVDYAQRPKPARAARRPRTDADRGARARVMRSAGYLFEHLHEVPALVVPCVDGRVDDAALVDQATTFGSILPAVWSFMLAARSRGLGTSWTTVHLVFEEEAAALLGIPFRDVTQVALIPVAHTLGADFRAAKRHDVAEVVHWDRW